MQNCEKAILVAYINITNVNKDKGMSMLNSFREYLIRSFKNEKEINDDSLITLVMPSDRTEIQLLNARYPDYKKIVELSEQKIKEYLDASNK